MLAVKPKTAQQPVREHPYAADARREQPFDVYFDGRWVTITPVSNLIIWPNGKSEWRVVGYFPHLYYNR